MSKVDIAGLQVDALTKQEFLAAVEQRLAQQQKTFVTTPYSEFLYAALRDRNVLAMLNKADIAIADGIGILWAQRFLSVPFTVNNYYGKIVQAWWQMVYTGAGILLWPQSLYRVIPEKITGANIVWDLAKLASDNNYSLYLLGGFGDTPQVAARKLQQRYPQLKVVGGSNKGPNDPSVITDIQQAQPDILLVAYGPIRQEQWITEHYNQLPAKLMIGLGGTFDYLAGKKFNPPRFIRAVGLEWLYRLITQPTRVRRIFRATIGLITALMRYKVFRSLPYRSNVACVVLNQKGEILICRRNPEDRDLRSSGFRGSPKYKDYWQFPQGGIDPNEPLERAARRELKEETGMVSLQVIGVSKKTNDYHYHNARRPLLFNKFRNKGQSQRIVYFHFEGQDKEIQPDNDEFIDFKWVSRENLIDTVHPERQPLAQIVVDDLKNYLMQQA